MFYKAYTGIASISGLYPDLYSQILLPSAHGFKTIPCVSDGIDTMIWEKEEKVSFGILDFFCPSLSVHRLFLSEILLKNNSVALSIL